MPKTLILLLLAAAAGASAAPVPAPEFFLAGGALRTCSDLAPSACRTPPEGAGARSPSTFLVDDAGIERALDPLLWQGRSDAPGRATLAAMLREVRRENAWERDALEDALDRYCADADARRCSQRPWRTLLADERTAVLAVLETPQQHEGSRRRERADLEQSRDAAGVQVLRAFVAAAAQRSPGERPRIAVVTASAGDPFDPVDFYLDAFRQLGADAQWWPVDAALNAAVFRDRSCDTLDVLRRHELRLPARKRVYPDLAQLQQRACDDAQGTADVPLNVQGVFFAGGDQWLHRRAFFDANDQPNAWLLALRKATSAGTLVVGGTSAGTAVQGGAAMLSNGTSEQALREGALARPPIQAGCGEADRCADGLSEDSLTYWPAGGLGLLPGWTMDTHFSERARELRLLVLMRDAGVRLAAGVDETSALHVAGAGDDVTLEAVGASGAWIFESLPATGDGSVAARVHYLAPGARFGRTGEGLEALSPLAPRVASVGRTRKPVDALADGALRDAAQWLASGESESLRLRAGAGYVTLSRTADSRAWREPGGLAGLSHLTLHYFPKDPSQP